MPDQWKAVFQLCCLALAEAGRSFSLSSMRVMLCAVSACEAAPARIAIYGSCAARADVDAEAWLCCRPARGRLAQSLSIGLLCQKSRPPIAKEYNLQGETASGAPMYKAVASDLHIYFDPSCDGTTTDSRLTFEAT